MTLNEFDLPERFVSGTVGAPGQRTFFLQARSGHRIISVSLEKEQLAVLAAKLRELLLGVGQSAEPLPALVDNASLEAPIDDEFRVISLALAWDPERELVLIECHDAEPDEEGELVPGETLRVRVSAPTAAEFARRADSLISAGRPPCPLCGQPLDPIGHICPRANGYRR